MTCKECIHNAVCYLRNYCIPSDFANKCGFYFSDNVIDDIETLKHRSYLEGFHKAYQMYYKMFADIKAEIQASMDMYKGCEYIGDKARRDELWHVLEIIDNHTRKERVDEDIPRF